MIESTYKDLFITHLREIGVDEDNLFAFEDWKEKDNLLDLKKYIDDLFQGKFRVLTVLGTQGIGKSYTVAKGLEDYLKEIYFDGKNITDFARCLTHFELDMAYKECMNPQAKRTQSEVYRFYCSIPVLVIDEIGRGSWSEYSAQVIENIISKRYANRKETILISNKTKKELAEMLDSNIIDRLSGSCGRIWAMKGDSLR